VTEANRAIYERVYTPASLALKPASRYQRQMVALRLGLIEQYGGGKDILDLCCGTGAYLLPMLDRVRSAVAVDFSRTMLEALRAAVPGPLRPRTTIVQADARALPIAPASVDAVFSFASLYYVPEVGRAIAEASRVLRSGGHAVVELGARASLNTVVNRVNHRDKGWAVPEHIPVREMARAVAAAGLRVVDWRSFQLLPMYGAPRRLWWLYPILSGWWQVPLGISVGGRMLDERLSSLPGVRHVAFRHLIIARKP
jgi:ubiquinone/menaquinone biosynthesis C-methylase UbiE